MYKRVVSVGCHSLDAELMGGLALINYAKRGAKCTFVHATRGERGHKTLTEEEYGLQLLEENKKVAETMGCDSYWLGYKAGQTPPLVEFAKDLKEYFKKEQVDLVITHFVGSLHPRHTETHLAVKEAVAQLHREGYDITLYYAENAEDLVGWVPQRYMSHTQEEIDLWLKGLNEYEIFRGGVNTMPYYDYYMTSLKIRGVEIGSPQPTRAYMYASTLEENM